MGKSHLEKVRPTKEARLKALGLEPLEEGEVCPQVRLRLSAQAWEVFRLMSSKERGHIVQAGLEALGVDYGKAQS